MQANIFKLARWLCAGAVLITGCSYEHPGPTLPSAEEAAPSPANAAPPASARMATVSSSKKSAPNGESRPGASTAASSPAIASSYQPLPQSPSPVGGLPSGPGEDVTAGLYPEGVSAAPEAGSGFDNIEVIGDSLKTKLAILRVGSQPTANQLLSVFAGFKNKSSGRLNLEVQTIYKDKTGTAINAGSWIPVILNPREETEYHSTSISADAVDFLVRVRLAQGAAP
jgi:hypothetical protein